MKKLILVTVITLFSLNLVAQNSYYNIVKYLNSNVQDSILLLNGDLKLYNLYKSEYICLYDYYLTKDTTQLYSQFYSTSYVPFAPLWNMFGFDSTKPIKYLIGFQNKISFDSISKRVKDISSINIDSLFKGIANKMYGLTGYKIKGKWYIGMLGNICGMCGSGSGKIMYIDLLFGVVNYEFIKFNLAHEFNHLILNSGKRNDSLASSCFGYFIDEGFATYVNYLFWDKVYSPAKNLMYTDNEYKWCLENEDKIFKDAEKLYLSKSRDVIMNYQFLGFKVYNDGPSMLAYFIGFRLCEKYVEKYGKDSWKDFYKLPYSEILNRLRLI